jgi:hypothetical protein
MRCIVVASKPQPSACQAVSSACQPGVQLEAETAVRWTVRCSRSRWVVSGPPSATSYRFGSSVALTSCSSASRKTISVCGAAGGSGESQSGWPD